MRCVLRGDCLGQSAPQSGRLGAFQKVMYQWSELHPFNAVHTCKISGPLAARALQEAVSETLSAARAGARRSRPRRQFLPLRAGLPPDIEVLPAGDNPQQALAAHVTRQLNRPFHGPTAGRFASAPSNRAPATTTSASPTTIGSATAWRSASSFGKCWPDIAVWKFLPAKGAATLPTDLSRGLRRPLRRLEAAAANRWSCGWFGIVTRPRVAYSAASQMAMNYESLDNAGNSAAVDKFSGTGA